MDTQKKTAQKENVKSEKEREKKRLLKREQKINGKE